MGVVGRLRLFLLVAALPAVVVFLAAEPASAAAAKATVRSSIGLNIRSGPDLSHKILSRLANRATVTFACQVTGQQIAGTQRTTSRWDRLSTIRDSFRVHRHLYRYDSSRV